MSGLVRNLQQLREEVTRMQDQQLSVTILTPILKQYEGLIPTAMMAAPLWRRPRMCSLEALCAEEARLR